MAARYRVISLDLRTGTRIAEIPLKGLRYSKVLNGVGEVTGRLVLPPVRALTQTPLDLGLLTEDGDLLYAEVDGDVAYSRDPAPVAARALAQVYNDAVDEARRHLFVERNGIVVGDGIVWKSPYDDDNVSRDVRAKSTRSYLERRRNAARAVFTATDQFAIVRSLINTMQAASGGNIGITGGVELCGVTRDIVYEKWELTKVADAIDQLAAMSDGFDWAIDCSWDPVTGAPIKQLSLHYPRRGRNFAQSGHVFELGRNIVSFTWPSSGEYTANRLYGVGDGMEDAQLISIATDATQIAAVSSGGPGYPLLEDVVSLKDVKEQWRLDSLTRQRLKSTAKPVTLPQITVRADMDPELGSYIEGDACRIVIPPNMTPRFPEGLTTFRRIEEIEVDVSDEGDELVILSLGVEPDA